MLRKQRIFRIFISKLSLFSFTITYTSALEKSSMKITEFQFFLIFKRITQILKTTHNW
jgi:hypothetical protein